VQRADFPDYPRSIRHDRGPVKAGALVALFLALTGIAVAAFHLPGVKVTGQELSFRRSVFAAVNATTLTGFQQDVGSSLAGADVLRLILTLVGTLFTLTAGGMAVVRIARMNYTDRQVIWAAGVATIATTIGGAAFLLDSDRGLIASLLQASSAFGNSGLYAGRLPGVMDWRTHGVLLPLAFAGALGVPVLMELFDRVTGARRLSIHSRRVLVLAAGFYLVGFALIASIELLRAAPTQGGRTGEWIRTLAFASTLSVNARTTGLPFEFAAAMARPLQWVLIALMIVGGSPGGTAGGLKTTTVTRLLTGVRDNLLGRHLTRSFGIAACWAILYFVTVFIGFGFLLHTEGDVPADRLLFLAFSAVSNAGLSHDPVSITGDGLFTLSGLMLAGRLGPLLILWWMATSGDEDPVAVG
jgi:Trk-type K+ transport system membrane component